MATNKNVLPEKQKPRRTAPLQPMHETTQRPTIHRLIWREHAIVPTDVKLWEIIENKVCTGTECKEIKSGTSNKESDQVDKKSTVTSTTPGSD